MPANTKRKPQENKKSTNNWNGFVRCDLTRHDKEECREFISTIEPDVVWQWWVSVVDDFKATMSHDLDHDCYIASMTGSKHADPQFAGWTLTARASSPEGAVTVLMYKHTVLLEQTWVHENDGYPEEGDKIG